MAKAATPKTPGKKNTAKKAGAAKPKAAKTASKSGKAAATAPAPATATKAGKTGARKAAPRKAASRKPTATRRTASRSNTHPRPWIENYPEGIAWDTPIDTTPVHERVLAACDRRGETMALDFLGARTSFSNLGKQIRAFCGALQAEFGVGKGTRVALLLPNTPFYPVAYYAVLMAGGTVVNCNPLYTLDELSHIMGDSKADLMITLDLSSVFQKAETLCASGKTNRLIVCHFPTALPAVKRLLFSIAKRKDLSDWRKSAIADKCTSYEHLMAADHAPKPVRINPDKDVAVQQYTGGTTGEPKGAMLSHANIAANVSQIDVWGCGLFNPPTRVVAVLPFFHIFAMTVCLNVPLANGAAVTMLPRFELKALLDLFKRTGANVMPAVPTLTLALANASSATREALSSLEVVISGGAALPHETRQKFARKSDALLAEGYGLTEASPVVCCSALRVASKDKSIGLPIPATDIRFADIENPNKGVKQGERGELQVKGPQVMLSYFGDDAGSSEAFVDGWLRTGDVGYMDDEGYVFLVDRIKDLIICSGYNVYPRNIEEALYQHEAVAECNVIGVPDAYRGEAPVAFVKLRENKTASAEDLKTFLAGHISKIEIPRDIVFRDELPKTLVGKLSKTELRDEYARMKNEEPSHEQA